MTNYYLRLQKMKKYYLTLSILGFLLAFTIFAIAMLSGCSLKHNSPQGDVAVRIASKHFAYEMLKDNPDELKAVEDTINGIVSLLADDLSTAKSVDYLKSYLYSQCSSEILKSDLQDILDMIQLSVDIPVSDADTAALEIIRDKVMLLIDGLQDGIAIYKREIKNE